MICSSFNPPFELLTPDSLRKQILESHHNTPGTIPAAAPNRFVIMTAPTRRTSERESVESLPVIQISQIEGNVL
jgi:hypothetical protein